MNPAIQFAYDHSPVAIQEVMLSVYGRYLKRTRYGPQQRSHLQELDRSQWLSPSDLERIQLERLRAIVRHARDNTEFYADLPPVDALDVRSLPALPVVSKEMVQAAGRALIARQYKAERLLEIHTGGTTGKPLTIYCNSATLQRNYAFFARFRSWTGFRDGERVATFAGRNLIPPRQRGGPYWRRNRVDNTWLFSSYHIGPATVGEYAQALSSYRPALIDSYPSSLLPVAQYLQANRGVVVRPRAVITSSETLDDEVRGLFSDAFDCPVFDHYGSAEMAALITQCEQGTYHINSEFGIVELLDDFGSPVGEGEVGQIVATGFLNDVMPLIRYATGDLAVKGRSGCSCGRSFPTVERVIGRMDDVLVTPDGRRIGRLDPVFKVINGIFESQILQTHRDKIRVEIVPATGYDPAQCIALRRELERRVGPSMTVEVVEVPQIQRARSGKLRTVVNLVDPRGRLSEPPGSVH